MSFKIFIFEQIKMYILLIKTIKYLLFHKFKYIIFDV